jgi:4-amino-4-deoxychorismate lyase
MNQSRRALFGCSDVINLSTLLLIPHASAEGIFKCRVTYSEKVEKIEYEAYHARIIKTLKIVEDDSISYMHKYTDRNSLNELFAIRGTYDDILIIKHGLITDTSYSNILFYDGLHWITPDTPLLPGTQRSFLLKNQKVVEKHIKVEDLRFFEKARLINAMLPFESGFEIPVDAILT